ncbi:hypothetical protein BKA62DRAFT_697178 [Auriculariales sp. MPI-PUGE-AT-0066]|nr:hypothetical protein BKA62DRAFT_697178 [Auriculariales sp. MPI-PUGE-AT-0066]
MLKAHTTALPLELLQVILTNVVTDILAGCRAKSAARLVLISREARRWLNPIIYKVFLAQLPDRVTSPHGKAFTYLLRMCIAPDPTSGRYATARQHIQHLALTGPLHAATMVGLSFAVPLRVESLAVEDWHPELMQKLNVIPNRLWIANPHPEQMLLRFHPYRSRVNRPTLSGAGLAPEMRICFGNLTQQFFAAELQLLTMHAAGARLIFPLLNFQPTDNGSSSLLRFQMSIADHGQQWPRQWESAIQIVDSLITNISRYKVPVQLAIELNIEEGFAAESKEELLLQMRQLQQRCSAISSIQELSVAPPMSVEEYVWSVRHDAQLWEKLHRTDSLIK